MTAACLADDPARRRLLDRRTGGRPVWEDAHSPLHSREFLTAPRTGTLRRVSAHRVADALGPSHPLHTALTHAGPDATVMVHITAAPERRPFSCLAADPVQVYAEINDQTLELTLAAEHVTASRHLLAEPVPIGELKIRHAAS